MKRDTEQHRHNVSLGVLTVNEACRELRLSRATFARLIRSKKIRSLRVGARRLVRASELERFLRAVEEH